MARPLGHNLLSGRVVFVDNNTRYYPMAASVSAPLTLPGILGASLVAWWNADDATPGTLSTWTDRVGSLAVTATTTAQPTASASSWTFSSVAKAALTFDGVANCLVATSFPSLPTGATPGEIWALGNDTSAAGGFKYICRYGAGVATATERGILSNNDARQSPAVTDGVTAILATTSPALTNGFILGANWSGTTEAGRIDGQDTIPATATIATLATGTVRIRIGAVNLAGAGSFFVGTIRHVIVTTILTTLQRQQVEGWLAWDGWSGQPASSNPLPGGHPYKNRAP